jgi:acetyl esterase
MSDKPPFVRPDVRRLLDMMAAMAGPKAHEIGAVAARQLMAAGRELMDLPRGELAVVRDLTVPGPAGAIPVRLYDPRDARAPGPMVIFFHGGGFVLGDLESHDPGCAAIARGLDLPVLAVDYRLAPEHPWPAAADDCEAVARAVAEGAIEGIKATGLVLTGDSAGGNLTIVTAMALRGDPAALPVLAQWPIYPVSDMVTAYPSFREFGEGYFLTAQGMDWFGECYAGDTSHWRCSPGLSNQQGMPPTLVVTASLDPLRDQGRAYAAACALAGVPTVFREAKGTIHGFLNMRKALPSAEGDLNGCLVALRAMTAEAEATRVMAEAEPVA